jgi:hypothetical protein
MSRPGQRIIAGAVGLLFLTTGVLKAIDPSAFAIDIQNYRILPWGWGVALALYLPWVEILCGGALLLRIAYRGALAIAGLMLGVFIVAYGSTRPRGLDIGCGCFGHGIHRGYWLTVIGDALLLATVLWLLKVDSRAPSTVIRHGGVRDRAR